MTITRRSVLSGTCAAVAGAAANSVLADDDAGQDGPTFHMTPIGRVEISGSSKVLRIEPKFQPGLLGLDGYSHVVVLYWFDRNDTPAKRQVLQVHPRGNKKNPLTGVFACRSPFRPNLIALTVCRILAVEGGAVKVENIDAFDKTPILDLKPYIPAIDSAEQVRMPDWVTGKKEPPK
ncbi:MAG: S-adenosyl-L-methionine-binding protein [Planctomycetes bacterium ADurb.Bin126]|nr:MAG: S-adenosyl-L-methionine-binding protein [Planctomycetes bacterium ADurb.Bin126]HOD81924.1 tRNA (N6-threonylcarbamoyladenosine(37)-N6)-methyltransferase TrmO [Phycisphaerae bacterium]HQL74139.1 tRNA (N6-threonylcarbamoyladenosine(37)-N6)-methyltransferase TrmO [Phycisphaerae bacterium]